jgi:hypothetical protein
MLKSLRTLYLNMSISIARTVIVIVALISFLGFHHGTSSRAKSDQDGPIGVKYDRVFQTGDVKIEPFDLADLPPLPAGYVALNNKAYRITTSAIVAGRHTVRFAVPSVTEEDTFQKLRIFRVDNDPFDPDGYVWVDVTLLKSSTAPPSFSTKTIYGQSEGLGIYVVAKLIREVPPNAAIADLVVTTSGVPDHITAPNLISYTIKVFNQGPDSVIDIGIWDSFAGPAYLVSVEPSQGKCKPTYSAIVCKPGFLKAGESIIVSVKLKPDEGRGSFPQDGREITHNAGAKAVEKDPATQNNEASDTVLVFPDPNQLPSVTLNSPADHALFVGPVDITLEATATDSDGSISKVEFFDSDKSLGFGTSVDGKNFVLTARGVSYGTHWFEAVATDNGGRTDWSLPREVVVNGLSIVSVKTPRPDSSVAPGSDLTLIAVASHPSGIIDKVQFFANGRLLGEGSLSGPKTYSFNWKALQPVNYSIAVLAIDGSGIPTVSPAVKFTVGIPPEVAIISPSDLARFSSSSNLTITAKARPVAGVIQRVDFYANGRLIGSASDIATDTFNFIWRSVPEGQHTLKVVAVDEWGVTGNSKSITVRVGKPQE